MFEFVTLNEGEHISESFSGFRISGRKQEKTLETETDQGREREKMRGGGEGILDTTDSVGGGPLTPPGGTDLSV